MHKITFNSSFKNWIRIGYLKNIIHKHMQKLYFIYNLAFSITFWKLFHRTDEKKKTGKEKSCKNICIMHDCMSEAAEYNVCISTKYKLMRFFRVINFLYFRIHIYCCVTTLIYKRNWVFAANSDFIIPIT